jgi:predicted outer membrane repeat protein
MTNPNSVDSDADSRGPNHDQAPNQLLFDGTELMLLRTSPTLDDTDGDGRTDCEESDDPFRSPLVSDLPKLDVSIVDAIDVRLDVEYAEEQGTSREYGTELSRSQTQSTTRSHSHSVGASLTVGVEAEVGFMEASVTTKTEFTVNTEHSYSASYESSKTSQESYSEYTTDSRTRTETVASGSMSMGIRLSNPGDITYTITDFGITVRRWLPGSDPTNPGAFKTLATLIPALGGGITLAPGAESPVLQVEATDLNASRVKDFLARPDSLYLEPAYYELENAEGMNFAFLEEITGPRTAWVLIDYGDGTTEEYRVATNVNRDPDGSWAGVTMGEVMDEILGIPCTTRPRRQLDPLASTNELVLHSVRGVATNADPTRGFWIVVLGSETQPAVGTGFRNITLHGKENVLLHYVRDDDGDGLYAAEEQHYRTDDGSTFDTDGDGLDDVDEIRGETFLDGEGNSIPCGWVVTVAGSDPYPVVSDPVNPDQDGDGMNDYEEKTRLEGGYPAPTDPTLADTDRDGIDDLDDPWPLNPANVLYVWQEAVGANDGTSWQDAYVDLQDALATAQAGYNTTGDPDDDVGEIWVATGTYTPTADTGDRDASFSLVPTVGVYGGFTGVESTRSARNPDPVINGTVLSGDLDQDGDPADNSYRIVAAGYGIGANTVLDGCMISGANNNNPAHYYGGGIYCEGVPTLRNLFFLENHANNYGGAICLWYPAAGYSLTISNCTFIRNISNGYGGALCVNATNAGSVTIEDCIFAENKVEVGTITPGSYQGGALMVGGGELIVKRCTFNANEVWEESEEKDSSGGAISMVQGKAWISDCRFSNNVSTTRGGAVFGISTDVVLAQCSFWNNETRYVAGPWESWCKGGGGFFEESRVWAINCTFTENAAHWRGGGLFVWNTDTIIDNSIFYGNTGPHEGANLAIQQIDPNGEYTNVKLRFTCLQEVDLMAGWGWDGPGCIGSDPLFKDAVLGDLHLSSSSPCIDTASNYVDYDPLKVGFQILPVTDLDGYWRIVDGNQDGEAVVDMGPYEYHGN